MYKYIPEAAPPELFCKRRCSYIFCNIHRKTPVSLQASRPATLIKKRLQHSTGIFLKILRNFYEHLLWRTSVNSCFWYSCEQRDYVLLQRGYVKICDRNNLLVFEYYFCHKFSCNLSEIYCLRLLFSYKLRIHKLICRCHMRKS